MGRAMKFDRDAAIDWVMNEIWQVGFEALSVKTISEKLGITRSSFYNTFISREALFVEALERYFSLSPDRRLEGFADSPNLLKLLTEVFKEACRQRTDDTLHRGCLAVNSISELVGVNEELGPKLEDAIQYSISRFEQLLDLCVSRGELPNTVNTRHLALAIQNLLMGMNTLSKVVKSKEELWAGTKLNLQALNLYQD